jgi:hypothetical protein
LVLEELAQQMFKEIMDLHLLLDQSWQQAVALVETPTDQAILVGMMEEAVEEFLSF